jgi:hypothetical protein
MFSSRTGKLHNILKIDEDEITPEQIELMRKYEGVIFTSPTFYQSLDCIPANIKYIDISSAQSYLKPLTNLSAALLGIAFSANLPSNDSLRDFAYLPYGIKIVYFPTKFVNWDISILISEFPPTVEYIVFYDKIYIIDITNREVKKIIRNDFHKVKSEVIFDILSD